MKPAKRAEVEALAHGAALPVATIVALTLLTRIPFIWSGYGLDADCWRLIKAGSSIRNGNSYVASRLPGYPVYEYFLAVLNSPSSWFSNLLNSMIFATAAVAFYAIAKQTAARGPLALTLALAFVPILWINSTSTIDYVPALTLLLFCWLSALRGRTVLAGIMLGIAVGTRLTTVLSGPALFYFLCRRSGRKDWKSAFMFTAISAVTALICFAPVLGKYGFSFLSYSPAYRSWAMVVFKGSYEVWGALGSVAIACCLCLCVAPVRWVGLFRSNGNSHPLSGVLVRVAVIQISLCTLQFIWLPHEGGYLIPAIPFVLLLLGWKLSDRVLVTLPSFLLVSSLVFSITRSGIRFAGPVLLENKRRATNQQFLSDFRMLALGDFEQDTIICGEFLPIIHIAGVPSENTKLAYHPNEMELRILEQRGHTIWYIGSQDQANIRIAGADPKDFGAKRLPLENQPISRFE